MEKKLLLLDIDNTIMYEQKTRPYLAEFLLRMSVDYDIGLYTAAPSTRIAEARRAMHKLGLSEDFTFWIGMCSLHRGSCPMIPYGSIEIKCLRKAAERFQCDYDDIAYLIDDMPMHDNPDGEKRIQITGWMGDPDDTVLRDFQLP